jgi:acyl-coenzyme A thioesterase PaaI-like protein
LSLSPTQAYFAASDFILALASVHSDLVISLKPVPLQLFMPLQLFLADLQSDMPLQEFTPEQCMVAASAAKDAVGTATVNNIAAAAAMAALDTLLMCMIDSSIVIERSDIAAPLQRPGQPGDYYPTA